MTGITTVTVTALFVNDNFRGKSGRLCVLRLAVTLLLVGCTGQAREVRPRPTHGEEDGQYKHCVTVCLKHL